MRTFALKNLYFLLLFFWLQACTDSASFHFSTDGGTDGAPTGNADLSGASLAQMAPPYQPYAVVWGGANAAYGTPDIEFLADQVAAAHMQWVSIEVQWALSEPAAPTTEPSDWTSVYGPRVAGYHTYNFAYLDQVVIALRARGIHMAMKFYQHPTWAGGQTCAGFKPACGVITNQAKATFRDNLYDLAYHLAERYGDDIQHWIVWNEPNLDQFFSPEPPLTGQLWDEYQTLVAEPIHTAIRSIRPHAVLIGPELFSCRDNINCRMTDKNWGYRTSWLDWADALVAGSGRFDIISLHNYSKDDRGVRGAVNSLWTVMQRRGVDMPIWTTEVNFKDGTCDTDESVLAGYVYATYQQMTWQRSFHYGLVDSHPTCGFGLVKNPAQNLAPKTTLLPMFRSIVDGTFEKALEPPSQ